MQRLRKCFRWLFLPWWIAILPKRKGFHPFFGPPTPLRGGPDLKIRKLKAALGNAWWPSAIYVLSGKPLPLSFLRLARRRGIRIVLNQNGVYYPAWYPEGYAEKNRELAALHEQADLVLYQSDYARRSTAQWVRPPERPSRILCNAVDTTRFKPLASPRRLGIRFRLLAATYFNPSKRYLLEALASLAGLVARRAPDVELLVAGRIHQAREGVAPPWLLERVSAAGGTNHFRYLGAYSQARAPEIYGQADALLHLVSLDCCPSAVLEALSSGLPVAFSDSGGTPELVGPAGVGIPVASNFERFEIPSLEAILNAVETLRSRHAELAAAARARAEALYDVRGWIAEHERALKIP